MSTDRMIKEQVKNENIFEYSKKITNFDNYFNSNHKKAIILCAGKGTRLKEWTKYSPKPLFPVKNKPIIEYNIEFLLDNGIRDIVLVVGYKAKQFNYIKNKYNTNIKLIYNDKYNKYNNWYSILKAKEEIIDNNVLIIDGDILIVEHNIKINNLKEDNYIFCQKGGNNWGITFDKDTKLVESIFPGDAKNEYIMFGFFYLNKEMTRDYIKEIEKLKENDYHDYAIINLIKNSKKFFAYLLELNMVIEIDSIQDVIDCKIMDKNEVKSIIKSKKLKNKIKKILLKILCMFIPSRKLRHIIRGRKNKYNELQSQINFLYQILDNTIEKTKMKPVKKIRDYQLKILDNLIFFDSICRKYDIKYWLDSGTLLGAIRHNGFIPWDDDLDVCVMREDYEKLYFEILPKELENSDYYFYIGGVNVKQKYDCQLLKIYGKESFIDVFAYDYYYGKLETRKDRIDFNKKYNLASNYYNDRKLRNDFNYFADVKKIIKEIINDNKTLKDNNNPKIIAGIDFPHIYKGEFDYDVIFPLKEIEFEGYKFFAPNNSNKYLKNMFGDDYDKLPRCSHSHSLIKKF